MSEIVEGSKAWHVQRKNRITGTRVASAEKENIW